MKGGSRISNLDFKARGRRPRGRRIRWALLVGIGCITAGVALTLLESAGAPAATPRAASVPEASSVTLRLTLPGQESATPADLNADPVVPLPNPVTETAKAVAPAERTAATTPETEPAASPEALTALAMLPGSLSGARIPRSAELRATTDTTPSERLNWTSYTVRAGDTLAALFQRAGLSVRDVYAVTNADDRAARLARIYPGDTLEIARGADGSLQAVRYQVSELKTLLVSRDDDGFSSSVIEHEPEVQLATARATIDSSLFAAGARVGLDDRLIMELAGIFGWDIDFALDIRAGDSFVVIYEELFRDGERLRSGDIVAAEFINQGEVFRAVRFTDSEGSTGYYTPEGRSMRKEFLRTPIDFARVSSGFNPQRLHPVLGYKRPHLGTDYAAATGTPIKAAGDGKIIHRGRKGGYGRTVIIQHGTRYTTLYAHMSRYASGQSVGSRVSQGEIIGYVGASGLATGPHLHYEFRVDGVHRNSRTVELPEADPIPDHLRDEFLAATQPYVAQLKSLSDTRLARATGD
jgi:murein DD-endopeptidase MepM/ murein hydrolase activator NlpD